MKKDYARSYPVCIAYCTIITYYICSILLLMLTIRCSSLCEIMLIKQSPGGALYSSYPAVSALIYHRIK